MDFQARRAHSIIPFDLPCSQAREFQPIPLTLSPITCVFDSNRRPRTTSCLGSMTSGDEESATDFPHLFVLVAKKTPHP